MPLLDPDEPHPVDVDRPDGRSPFLIACDHAGRRLPRRLGDLGLPASELVRHIAWDIGAEGVSRRLGDALDATVLRQAYSRLVIDCNRPTDSPTSIVEVSERTRVPGNLDLGEAERLARIDEIFSPYHARLAAVIDARAARGQPTVLVAMHSFTPVFMDVARPWHVGILSNRDRRLAQALLDLLEAEGDLVVGDNEPYSVSDVSDYTVPVHAERRGLLHVEVEIRQDLIADEAGQRAWADRFARLLPRACEGL